jgi:quinol monooxygenase YgiN
MPSVGRFVKMSARAGQGEALAKLMLAVAESLGAVDGCELYVINRSPSEPDVVWVNELWRDQDALDASLDFLRTDAGKAQLAEVMVLMEQPPERIDLEPLGGVGLPS